MSKLNFYPTDKIITVTTDTLIFNVGDNNDSYSIRVYSHHYINTNEVKTTYEVVKNWISKNEVVLEDTLSNCYALIKKLATKD